MLRKSGLIWAAPFFLLVGCDLFSTREIVSKPASIQSLQGLSKKGDSLSFSVTESLREPDSKVDRQVLAKKKLVFTSLGDSALGADSVIKVSLTVSLVPSGEVVEESVREIRFSGDGIALLDSSANGAARYFPLKRAAYTPANAPESASRSFVSDSAWFLALPSVFAAGAAWNQDQGILHVTRTIAGTDTLSFDGKLEEAWAVTESLSDGTDVFSAGTYWYGASGLLKSEQTWTNFDWRGDDATSQGKVILRRVLERM